MKPTKTIEPVPHKTVDSLVAGYFKLCGGIDVDADEVASITGVDGNGVGYDLSVDELKDRVREQGLWGFMIQDDTGKYWIHFWRDKSTPMSDLVYFFGHELGHTTEPDYGEDQEAEEHKADQFAEAARAAFHLAEMVNSWEGATK